MPPPPPSAARPRSFLIRAPRPATSSTPGPRRPGRSSRSPIRRRAAPRPALGIAAHRLQLAGEDTVIRKPSLSRVSTTKLGGDTSRHQVVPNARLWGSWKKSRAPATAGPMPSIPVNSANAVSALSPFVSSESTRWEQHRPHRLSTSLETDGVADREANSAWPASRATSKTHQIRLVTALDG